MAGAFAVPKCYGSFEIQCMDCMVMKISTVKILKIGTPKINTIIVLQMEQLDFTVQYCALKMQTE